MVGEPKPLRLNTNRDDDVQRPNISNYDIITREDSQYYDIKQPLDDGSVDVHDSGLNSEDISTSYTDDLIDMAMKAESTIINVLFPRCQS